MRGVTWRRGALSNNLALHLQVGWFLPPSSAQLKAAADEAEQFKLSLHHSHAEVEPSQHYPPAPHPHPVINRALPTADEEGAAGPAPRPRAALTA